MNKTRNQEIKTLRDDIRKHKQELKKYQEDQKQKINNIQKQLDKLLNEQLIEKSHATDFYTINWTELMARVNRYDHTKLYKTLNLLDHKTYTFSASYTNMNNEDQVQLDLYVRPENINFDYMQMIIRGIDAILPHILPRKSNNRKYISIELPHHRYRTCYLAHDGINWLILTNGTLELISHTFQTTYDAVQYLLNEHQTHYNQQNPTI